MKRSTPRAGAARPVRLALLVVTLLALCLAAVGLGAGAAGSGTPVGHDGGPAELAAGSCAPVTGVADAATQTVDDDGVRIVSPGATDTFHRGDIVPVELAFGDAASGTLTFGGGEQPVTLDVTVADADGSGRGTLYLNTFQVGNETRNHGAFAPGNGTEIVDATMQSGSGFADGPGGDGVIPAGSYDLAVAPGADPARTTAADTVDAVTLQLAERGSGNITVWTAPGSAGDLVDADTTAIQQAIDAGRLTPANGIVADGDVLVLELPATGLGGVLHEAALRNPDVEHPGAFLTGDSQVVTEPFAGSGQFDRGEEGSGVELWTADMDWCGPWTRLDHANQSHVLAERNGGIERYYVAMKLTAGEAVTRDANSRRLSPASELTTVLAVLPFGDGDNTTAPPLPAADQRIAERPDREVDGLYDDGTEVTATMWEFVDAVAAIDQSREVVAVTNRTGVELGGPTSVAAGTNLTVTVETPPGADNQFETTRETTVEYAPGGVGAAPNGTNRWGVTLDLAEYRVGTAFEVRVTRTDSGDLITPEEAPIQGVLTEEPRVEEFTFEDRHVEPNERRILVDTFDTTQGGFVAIHDESGELIGKSDFQPRGAQAPVEVPLDTSPPPGETELTAVAYRSAGEPYEADGEPVRRTASVTFEPEPPRLRIDDLRTGSVRISSPRDLDVSAFVKNEGEQEGTADAVLRLDGRVVNSTAVTLRPDGITLLTLTVPGEELVQNRTHQYRLEVGDDRVRGTITVRDWDDSGENEEPSVEIDAVDIGNVGTEGPIEVAVTVTNMGDRATAGTVELQFDGYARTLDNDTALLGADETATVTMTVPEDELMFNGYDVLNVSTSDDSEVATLPVEEGPTGTATATRADDDGPGLGVVVAVLTLLAVALLAWRRQR